MIPVVWRCPHCNLPVWFRFGYATEGHTIRFLAGQSIAIHLRQH